MQFIDFKFHLLFDVFPNLFKSSESISPSFSGNSLLFLCWGIYIALSYVTAETWPLYTQLFPVSSRASPKTLPSPVNTSPTELQLGGFLTKSGSKYGCGSWALRNWLTKSVSGRKAEWTLDLFKRIPKPNPVCSLPKDKEATYSKELGIDRQKWERLRRWQSKVSTLDLIVSMDNWGGVIRFAAKWDLNEPGCGVEHVAGFIVPAFGGLLQKRVEKEKKILN